MVRITTDDFTNAEVQNYEKVNGDYFIKTINANSSGDFESNGKMFTKPYDSVYGEHTTAYIDTYTYKQDGDAVATIVVTYADTAHTDFISAVRTYA
jgi:hypothetical protein